MKLTNFLSVLLLITFVSINFNIISEEVVVIEENKQLSLHQEYMASLERIFSEAPSVELGKEFELMRKVCSDMQIQMKNISVEPISKKTGYEILTDMLEDFSKIKRSNFGMLVTMKMSLELKQKLDNISNDKALLSENKALFSDLKNIFASHQKRKNLGDKAAAMELVGFFFKRIKDFQSK